MLLNTEAGYKYLKQNGYTEQQIGAGVRRTPHQTPDKQKEVTALPQPEQSTEKPPVKASLSETPQLGLNGAAQVPVGSGQVPPGKSGVPPGKSASFSATSYKVVYLPHLLLSN